MAWSWIVIRVSRPACQCVALARMRASTLALLFFALIVGSFASELANQSTEGIVRIFRVFLISGILCPLCVQEAVGTSFLSSYFPHLLSLDQRSFERVQAQVGVNWSYFLVSLGRLFLLAMSFAAMSRILLSPKFAVFCSKALLFLIFRWCLRCPWFGRLHQVVGDRWKGLLSFLDFSFLVTRTLISSSSAKLLTCATLKVFEYSFIVRSHPKLATVSASTLLLTRSTLNSSLSVAPLPTSWLFRSTSLGMVPLFDSLLASL